MFQHDAANGGQQGCVPPAEPPISVVILTFDEWSHIQTALRALVADAAAHTGEAVPYDRDAVALADGITVRRIAERQIEASDTRPPLVTLELDVHADATGQELLLAAGRALIAATGPAATPRSRKAGVALGHLGAPGCEEMTWTVDGVDWWAGYR